MSETKSGDQVYTLSLFNPEENQRLLSECNGVSGCQQKFATSFENGIDVQQISLKERRKKWGANVVPQKEVESWLDIFLGSFDDPTLKLLIGSALVSLCVGVYEGLKSASPSFAERFIGCIEGVAILTSVLLVASITASQEHDKETKFQELNATNEDMTVTVLRPPPTASASASASGVGRLITVKSSELVVGDVVQLESGSEIPADGIFITGTNVKVDQSTLNGESEEVGKSCENCFMFSSTRLTAGVCTMVVVAVGENSEKGRIHSKTAAEKEKTPLQDKLETLADQIGYVGMGFAAATFLALLARWYFTPPQDRTQSLFHVTLDAFIIAVTIVVVAVPEGLPLAVTISLAYSTKKMMADNNLIRILAACETMGNATTICSDKTGTLTQNRMTVVTAWMFGETVAGDHNSAPIVSSSSGGEATKHIQYGIAMNSTATLSGEDGSVVIGSKTEGALLTFLRDSFKKDYRPMRLLMNATAGDVLFTFTSTRKTMTALHLGGGGGALKRRTRSSSPASRGDSRNGSNSNLVSLGGGSGGGGGEGSSAASRGRGGGKSGGRDSPSNVPGAISAGASPGCVSYTKGAPEVILDKCTHYLTSSGEPAPLSEAVRAAVKAAIKAMSQQSLRPLALAHRTYKATLSAEQRNDQDYLESGLCLDAVVGIKDPLRTDVTDAVKACQRAGIFVRMVTGDCRETAVAIARECGILTENGVVLEGSQFRALSPRELDQLLPRLQVLARSSPEDKRLLVTRLNGNNLPSTEEEWQEQHPGKNWDRDRDLLLPGYKEEWAAAHPCADVVGATGDGTNDGPALKAADVGLSMGLSGTDVAKAASSIVIMDDNFASIVKAVSWGRSIFDNIRKFLQFQLTVNVVALSVTLISSIGGKKPPLNAVMMLWVNLIMDTMGALALGTEPPSPQLLKRLPYSRDASLISRTMWKNIAIQALFQIALMVYLLSVGHKEFGVERDSPEHVTVVFTTFVLCQMFNEINARSISNENKNVFSGIFSNWFFIGVLAVTGLLQYCLVESPRVSWLVRAVPMPLGAAGWYKCILLAGLTLPIGGLMRLVNVKDRPEDVAQPAEIVRHLTQVYIDAHGGSSGSSGSSGSGMSHIGEQASFALWASTCLAVVGYCCKEFGATWLGQWK